MAVQVPRQVADLIRPDAPADEAREALGLGDAAVSDTTDFAAALHQHTTADVTDFGVALNTEVDLAVAEAISGLDLGTAAQADATDFAPAVHTHPPADPLIVATVQGSTASAGVLTLRGTSHATPGTVTVVGKLSCPGTGTNAEAFGAGAQATATQSTSLGTNASAVTVNATVLGYNASTSGVGNAQVVVGSSAVAAGSSGVALGGSASAAGTSAVAIGGSASASSNNGVAIGSGAQATHSSSLAIGSFAASSATNQATLGGTGININSLTTGSSLAAGFTLAPRANSSAASTLRDTGKVAFTWVDSNDATRKGKVTVSACDASGTDREGLRVESDGTQALLVTPNGLSGSTASGGNLTLRSTSHATKGTVAVEGKLGLSSAGAANAPTLHFAADTTLGWWLNGAGNLALSCANVAKVHYNTGGIRHAAGYPLTWSSGDPSAVGADVGLVRASAGVVQVTDGGAGIRDLLMPTPIVRRNAAPADAELAAGDLALWLDPTNGSAKLKVKAKQADGTVVLGEIALA